MSVDIPPLDRLGRAGLRNEFRQTSRNLRNADGWLDSARRIRAQTPAPWTVPGGRRRLIGRILGRTDRWHAKTFNRRMRRFGGGGAEPLSAAQIGTLARRVDAHFTTIPRRFEAVLQRRLRRRAQRGSPFSAAALEREVQAAQRTARYYARRIATDQAENMVADLNRRRQMANGVERYEWQTAGDDRVRPTHSANNGRRFAWDNAPSTGHPGDAVQCRCVALPVFERRRTAA